MKDNINTDLEKVGKEGMDCTDPFQARDKWRALVDTVRNFRVP